MAKVDRNLMDLARESCARGARNEAAMRLAPRLIAFDPSSTSTGFAVFESEHELREFGAIAPSSKLDVLERISRMKFRAVELVKQHKPTSIVIEMPAPQAPGWAKGSRGQANYGVACGVIWSAVANRGAEVITTRADEWTRQASKEMRQCWVMQNFPEYEAKRDPGMDISDAIALGLWYFEQQRIERARAS